MDGALDLAVRALGAGLAGRIDGAVDAGHVAGLVHVVALALDDVRALEANLAVGLEAEVLLGRVDHEVLALDVDLTGERNLVRAHLRLLGMVLDLAQLDRALRNVGEHNLDRIEHRHGARGDLAQVVAHAVLEQTVIDGGVRLRNADAVDEVAHGGGGVAAAAHAGQRGHARIVPACDVMLLDQLAQLALAHDRVGQVQAGELDLAGLLLKAADVHHPVIQRAVNLVLQRAQGVGHALKRVADGMGEVVHRVDAPLVAGAVMRGVLDAVDGRIAQVDVRGGHVDLRAQGAGALRELAVLHAQEEVHVLLGRAVAVGRVFARLLEGAAVGAHLLLGQVVHIGQAAADQIARVFKDLIVLLAGVVDGAVFKAEPVDVVLDGLDKFFLFLGGVGIVKAQVADAAEFFRGGEVHGERLHMADMQIAVGLGRETGLDAAAVFALGQVRLDRFPDKVALLFDFFRHGNPSLEYRVGMVIPSIHNKVVYYTREFKASPGHKYCSRMEFSVDFSAFRREKAAGKLAYL